MCSASACEHCWSIEGWIHSKRRNRLHQTLGGTGTPKSSTLVRRASGDGSPPTSQPRLFWGRDRPQKCARGGHASCTVLLCLCRLPDALLSRAFSDFSLDFEYKKIKSNFFPLLVDTPQEHIFTHHTRKHLVN
jgi:hypothetical protein